MKNNLACVILAAGSGSRMKSDIPKPLHKLAGRSMLSHVIGTAEQLNPEKIIVVIGNDMDAMRIEAAPHQCVIQEVANGTGGAVLAAEAELKDFNGDVLVLFGDSPLIRAKNIKDMIHKRQESDDTGLVFSGMFPDNPGYYGRMVVNDDGILSKIVEFKDADEREKNIHFCNGGIVCAESKNLFKWLHKIGNNNAQGEYYLTDLPQIAKLDNRITRVAIVLPEDMEGANSKNDLAKLEYKLQMRYRNKFMEDGVTLIDPITTYFSYDTKIGRDVTIYPNVFFGKGVEIANNVTIHPFSHLEGCRIADRASIGPFARLRPDAEIGEDVKIGNFVEVKKSTIGKGSKLPHLSYIGDAEIGEKSNIGAGTITCNYDGFFKYKTIIGDNAFIGSNTALVAPVEIGNNTIIGAASCITKNVPENDLSLTRADTKNISGWAKKFKDKQQKKKDNS